MLTLCIAIGPKLFQTQPTWIIKQANFVTVGVQGQDNELGKTSLKQLAAFEIAITVQLTLAGLAICFSTAVLLHPTAPLSLVGQTLHSDDKAILDLSKEEPIRVSAIVENLPHYGILNASTPMIYVNSLSQSKANLKEVHLIFDPLQAQQILPKLQQFATEQGNLTVKPPVSLKQQLQAQNKVMQQLVFLALLFTVHNTYLRRPSMGCAMDKSTTAGEFVEFDSNRY
jgi:hypothetical protein